MQRPLGSSGKKRGLPGLRNSPDGEEGRGPTNWAFIDQKIMEAFSYTIEQAWELTISEVSTHMEKLTPTVAEPDWFVKSWRTAKSDRDKLLAMAALMDG